ncbi:MerR family transcriptional regulator [Orbus wheelerorum]|uniref:MerR family transcriptional regulator n=1 Tax=Orbus wheelerorum TaxID=3074111 RepID=UPI00370DCAFD
MSYTIKQFAQLVGLTDHTLRYYEKEQLLNPLRSSNGHRVFNQRDIDWIQFILRLKETGMPLKVIKHYAMLLAQGDNTIRERKEILELHQIYLDNKLNEWQGHREKLQQKIDNYHAMCQQRKCI